ncbi:hypothetical protein Sm713_48460 [Streptomyces sp. TS71-3]|nr:hypothetical protein Sm713_48460 [Streptomyces sp. TS71-3]
MRATVGGTAPRLQQVFAAAPAGACGSFAPSPGGTGVRTAARDLLWGDVGARPDRGWGRVRSCGPLGVVAGLSGVPGSLRRRAEVSRVRWS